jgi:hypothetical protein
MFYIIIFLIVWLLTGAAAFSVGGPVFWAFIIALVADILVHSWPYIRRG